MVRKPFSLIPFPVHGKKGNKAEIRLPSADEAVRIRAMKKLLRIEPAKITEESEAARFQPESGE